jgi:hypothetical protein
MFARKPGKNPDEVKKGWPQVYNNTAARAPAASSLTSTKPGSSVPQNQKKTKPGWFKKLMSTDRSDESVEWVSLDAARVERSVASK